MVTLRLLDIACFCWPADNFELTGEDELTLGGFLELHVMTGQDEEGGEGELREVLQSLGYSDQLQLDLVLYLCDIHTAVILTKSQ